MSGIGEILKSEREKLNINREEISRKTNISESILEDIENNDFSRIPGKFYLKKYLKCYLDAIDLDRKTFFDNHKGEIEKLVDRENEIPTVYYNKIKYSRFKRKKIVLGILILIVISIVLTYLFVENKQWFAGLFHNRTQSPDIPETGMVMNYQDEEIRPDFSAVTLKLAAHVDCWIQIYRGREKVVERVLKPGEKEEVNGYELRVTIGNPSAVTIWVNEKKVEKYQDRSNPVKFLLTPQKIDSLVQQ